MTTPADKRIDLLPCPFCGGEAKIVDPGFTNTRVVCATNGCGSGISVTTWNRRATQEIENEALERAAKRFAAMPTDAKYTKDEAAAAIRALKG